MPAVDPSVSSHPGDHISADPANLKSYFTQRLLLPPAPRLTSQNVFVSARFVLRKPLRVFAPFAPAGPQLACSSSRTGNRSRRLLASTRWSAAAPARPPPATQPP